MDDVTDLKATARRTGFAQRKLAHDRADRAGEDARDHFLASRLHTGCAIISAYRPIRTEIDPTPLMTALCAAGHRLAVPVILGAGQPLVFAEWWPGVEMRTGAFGAEVPVGTGRVEPDLLVMPLVAFDRAGWRMGYGGGFYDRTLEALRARRRTLAVGLAYAGQEMPEIPTEPTDQPMDAIVTEKGIIRP